MTQANLIVFALLCSFVLGCAGRSRMPSQTSMIEVAQSRHGGQLRYQAMGGEYTGDELVKILESRLSGLQRGAQIVFLLDDKRSDRDEVGLIREVSRVAERFGATVEVKSPRSSYDGETRVVP